MLCSASQSSLGSQGFGPGSGMAGSKTSVCPCCQKETEHYWGRGPREGLREIMEGLNWSGQGPLQSRRGGRGGASVPGRGFAPSFSSSLSCQDWLGHPLLGFYLHTPSANWGGELGCWEKSTLPSFIEDEKDQP